MVDILQERLNEAEEGYMRYKSKHESMMELEKQKSANFETQLKEIKHAMKEASENSSNTIHN